MVYLRLNKCYTAPIKITRRIEALVSSQGSAFLQAALMHIGNESPPEERDATTWVVRVHSRNSFGKLITDLDEYFKAHKDAEVFYQKLLGELEPTAQVMIAEFRTDRFGDEHLHVLARRGQ